MSDNVTEMSIGDDDVIRFPDGGAAMIVRTEDYDSLIEAARHVLTKIDYLQGLWGKEAITSHLVEGLRSAVAKIEATVN